MSAASASSISDLLGRHVEGACRIVLRHERTRRFRPWGVLELLLKILAAIVLLPFRIYPLFSAMALSSGEEIGGSEVKPAPGRKPRLRKSALFEHGHAIVVEALGPEGHVLTQVRAEPRGEDEGLLLVASIVRLAQPARIAVVETIALEGQGQEIARVWHGGRPLMAAPDLQPADALSEVLRRRGYTVTRDAHAATVRLVEEPMSRVVAGLLAFVAPGVRDHRARAESVPLVLRARRALRAVARPTGREGPRVRHRVRPLRPSEGARARARTRLRDIVHPVRGFYGGHPCSPGRRVNWPQKVAGGAFAPRGRRSGRYEGVE